MDNYIYLDNAASSLPYKECADIYYEIALKYYANPSSIHRFGVECNYKLDEIRSKILKILGLTSNYEVIFTSGATEANNLAIKGIAFNYAKRGKHIITSKIEHPSVLEVFSSLHNDFGFKVTYLDVDSNGRIDLKQLENNLDNETILVSIMGVNNETGTVNDLKAIKELLTKYPKIYFHTDLVQAVGKVKINLFNSLDLFTITGHKIHGLKGCGVLIKKKNICLKPQLNGGGQEYGYRSGTLDLAHAYSFMYALDKTFKDFEHNFAHVNNLKNILVNYLNSDKENYHLNSYDLSINPYILNFSSLRKKAAVIVEALSNEAIYVSSVSSCHSKKEKISYVIEEMSHNQVLAHNTIRISFSYLNSEKDIFCLIEALERIVKDIKQ